MIVTQFIKATLFSKISGQKASECMIPWGVLFEKEWKTKNELEKWSILKYIEGGTKNDNDWKIRILPEWNVKAIEGRKGEIVMKIRILPEWNVKFLLSSIPV